MLALNVNNAPKLIPVPAPKLRLLLVTDSLERLKTLQFGINSSEFIIDSVCSIEELSHACRETHDLVALDVFPSTIVSILKLIRASAGYAETPLFVESERINSLPSLAGVLPIYRAMPCNHAELLTLLRQYRETANRTEGRRRML